MTSQLLDFIDHFFKNVKRRRSHELDLFTLNDILRLTPVFVWVIAAKIYYYALHVIFLYRMNSSFETKQH